LLAIIDSLRAWRPYLLGIPFKIQTDHATLPQPETAESAHYTLPPATTSERFTALSRMMIYRDPETPSTFPRPAINPEVQIFTKYFLKRKPYTFPKLFTNLNPL
jgi:hypothetical protein